MTDRDRLTRWRLVLGGEQSDGIGEAADLDGDDVKRDEALRELYEGGHLAIVHAAYKNSQ